MIDHEILQRIRVFQYRAGRSINDAHDLKPSGVSRADDAQDRLPALESRRIRRNCS
jgi:hypothetical protein